MTFEKEVLQVFEVRLTVTCDGPVRRTWEDIEWAVQDLLFDDEDGNPNFQVGCIVNITAEEIKMEDRNVISSTG